jgi:hypothetical protein
MCNRKDEGGRCYAHLNQFIQSLDKREEQEIYNGALKAGVPFDEEALRTQTASVLADCEKEREDFKAEVAAKRELMMELHKTAQTELRRSLVFHDGERRGGFIENPFVKAEDGSKAEDLPGFSGFEETQNYLDAKRFTSAVAMEKRKVSEQLAKARKDHAARSEKEAVRNNIELRSLKRQILMAEAKEFLNADHVGKKSYELEKEYDSKLKEDITKNGQPFHETEECKSLQKQMDTLETEFSHAEHYEQTMTRALQNHWHGSPNISYNDRGNHPREVARFLKHEKGNYEKLKGGHYARRFRSAKEDYVRLADSEPKWQSRQDKAVKDVTKNPPLKQDAFETYKATVYPTTSVAKEIKSQRETAQKELVLTPTYRKNLKSKITQMYYEGYDTTKERATLQKLDNAAAERKNRVAAKQGKRPKLEEPEELSQGLYSRTTEAKIADLDALADKLNNPPTIQERAQGLKNLAQRLNNR